MARLAAALLLWALVPAAQGKPVSDQPEDPDRPPSSLAATLQQQVTRESGTGGAKAVSLAAGTVYDFGASNLVIDEAQGFKLLGRQARLRFAPGFGVVVNRSSDVYIGNLSVEYRPPCFSQGTVEAADHQTIRFRLQDAKVFAPPDSDFIRSAAEVKVIFWQRQAPYDLVTNQPGANGMTKVVRIAPDLFNITLPHPPPPGTLVTVGPRIGSLGQERGGKLVVGPTWASSGYFLADSARVVSEEVTLLGGGGFGVLESGGACGHRFLQLRLKRDEDLGTEPPPLLSSNIDGFHSWSCGEGPIIADSEIRHCGDDVLNIHGALFVANHSLGGVASAGPAELYVVDYGDVIAGPRREVRMLSTFRHVGKGERLQFFRGSGKEALAAAVLAVERVTDLAAVRAGLRLPGHLPGMPLLEQAPPHPEQPGAFPLVFKVKLDAAMPVGAPFYAQWPKRLSSGAVLRNNTFGAYYDRASVLASSGTVFEGNRLECKGRGHVSITCYRMWLEATLGLGNVSVRDNVFMGCGRTAAQAVSTDWSCVSDAKSITVEGNVFKDSEEPLLV